VHAVIGAGLAKPVLAAHSVGRDELKAIRRTTIDLPASFAVNGKGVLGKPHSNGYDGHNFQLYK
jgi:hypothetical protein